LTTEAVFYWLPAPQSQTYIWSLDVLDIDFVELKDRVGPSWSLGMTNSMGELWVWTTQSCRVSKGGELGSYKYWAVH
jgi:hypothetical protein